MSDKLCPVPGCTNVRDTELDLCWRHRQFVQPKLIGQIKRANTMRRKANSDFYEAHWTGERTKAVNAAAGAAHAWERDHAAH